MDLKAGVPRLIGRALLIGLGLLLASNIVALNFAEMAVRSRSPAAVAAASSYSSQAASMVAEASLAAGRQGKAEALARRSLLQRPLSAEALRTLGLALETQGSAERAREAMRLAGALGWRDTPTQLWLINAAVLGGDYEEALLRTDALARRGQLPARTQAVFMAAALDPAGRPALIERLSLEPSWRSSFFASARRLPPGAEDRYAAFLRDFAAAGGEVGTEEVAGFIGALIEQGRYAQARRVFLKAGGVGGTNAAVSDGGFEQAALDKANTTPFEWSFPRQPGGSTALGSPPNRTGSRALHTTSRGNAPVEVARQVLTLTPGAYTFAVDALAGLGTRLEGFSWTVECLPSGPRLSPTQESRAALDDGWTRLEYDFVVPPSGCGGQNLKLRLHSGGSRPLDLWFDTVAVKPAAGTP